MRQTATKTLFRHWSALARNGAPPDRNDLEPAAFAAALQDVFILGRGPDAVWRYRVAGTRLSAYADRDLRGEDFTQWWRPADRKDIGRLIAGAVEDRAPISGGLQADDVRGARHDFEFLLLPLRHGGIEGVRMIGGFFPAPETARLFDVRLSELAVLSLRAAAEPAATADSFGRPRTDLDALVERRHRLTVIEGGLSRH